MSKRIGSIDFFRGFCMFLMLIGHIALWLVVPADFRAQEFIWIALEPIAKGTGFILISGTSIALSLSGKSGGFENADKETKRLMRNTAYLRALLLLCVALIFNVGLLFTNPEAKIYDWWILFTLSICLMFTWPLMKLTINSRLIIGVMLLVFDYFFFQYLNANLNNSPIYADLMEFFFPSDTRQNPILSFFPFYLFGTIIGSLLTEVNFYEGSTEDFVRKVTLPVGLPSVGFLIFGILFNFPGFLVTNSFSYIIYAIGLNSLLVTVLLTIDKITNFNFNSKYSPLFYYSFYSLTFYLLHYIIMFFPPNILNGITFWIVVVILNVVLMFIFNLIYRKIKGLFSLKYLVSAGGLYFAIKIEEKFYNITTYADISFIDRLKMNISSD
ncbi:MAG: putative Acyltransferase family protein [Promethearchaeota archaeon]|nr:MAG: putative Acyltransferase family protein [Candidatus Lokiarchaeota archaeon]